MRHPAPSSSRLRAPRRPSPSRRLRRRLPSTPRLARGSCRARDVLHVRFRRVDGRCGGILRGARCRADRMRRTANRVAGCRFHAADRLADAVQRAANGVARARTRACRIRAGASLHAHAATEQRRLNLRADTCGTLGTGLGRLCESSRSRHRRQCSTHQNRTNRVHGHSPQRRCCCGPPSCGLSHALPRRAAGGANVAARTRKTTDLRGLLLPLQMLTIASHSLTIGACGEIERWIG